ncbi:hypothetical protein [Sphingobacterium cellulitidis]|uniref:hypothetical protein n=1 Tax=Sphingobacterium cellulitidis TaxID=1768011 RepID=UPI000B94590F|nr:hypothetical protein CHT99_10175 [Sphingobacterium cellulitidis]
MILIITHKLDFTADFIINKLNERGIPYKRFNCEEILENPVTFELCQDFRFNILGETNYSSVWFRRIKLPDIDLSPISYKNYILSEIDSFLHNIFSVLSCKWISEPYNVYKAENKILQLKTAQMIGFKIPITVVTTDKEKVSNFFQKCGKTIIKPISRTRIDNKNVPEFIFTNRIDKDHRSIFQNYDLTPCIFQEEIGKDLELRVTVVGDNIFAAQIKSQDDDETKIDWRRKKMKFTKFELPNEISNKCLELVHRLNLNFGAIDLILSPNGEYTFLEINPNGQWVWIENDTGLKISDALINLLQSK